MTNNHISQVPIGSTFNSPFGQGLGFGDLISILLSNIVVLSSITFFILILLGGFAIMSGAGNKDPQSVARGKQMVTSALIGFIVVFCAYWIVLIVQTVTGVPILSSPF